MSRQDAPTPDDIEASRQVREERARLAAQHEANDIRWLMGQKRGRRYLWRHLEQAGVFRLSFNTNAMQMAFNEGARNAGNRTLNLIHAVAPEQYHVMVGENA
jgi:hypothetical protein